MKIGIIGDEPAGPVLAKAWANSGHEVIGAAVESPIAIERIEALLPDVPIASMLAVAEDADLVLLAVPNSDVELVCDGIAGFGLFGPKKLVVHLSPLAGIRLLGSAINQGAVPIALHPVMHFTGTTMDLQVLKNTTIAVSAPEVLLPIAQALAIELGAEPVVVSDQQREAYAEAFEVASGFSSLVVRQAIGILEAVGMENPARLIAPVVRAAVEQALAQGAIRINPEDFR